VLFEISTIQSIIVVTLRATQLSKVNCARVRKSMAAATEFRNPTIIDLGFTEYFDTSGLSLILQWLSEGRRLGGKVVICSDSPEFRSLSELVRISSFTAIYSSLGEALDSFRVVAPATYDDEPAPANRVQHVRAATAG
jgi:anti-anti-sigma factor